MKSFITLAIAMLLTLGLSAQARFEFAPSVGISISETKFQRSRHLPTLYGGATNFRFLVDFERVQLGTGFSFHRMAGDLFTSFESSFTGKYLEEYAVPYFFYNYKFAKPDYSYYYYIGAIVGMNMQRNKYMSEAYELQGMFGASIGIVSKLGERIDLEISETYNVVPNGRQTPYYKYNAVYRAETFAGSGRITQHTFTTNIGIRIHRKRKAQAE